MEAIALGAGFWRAVAFVDSDADSRLVQTLSEAEASETRANYEDA
jgi:hypothetical protein